MHTSPVTSQRQQQIIAAVQARMRREGVTQAALADLIGKSQGHLSKVLRNRTHRDTSTINALADWVGANDSSYEGRVMQIATNIAQNHPQGRELVMHLMQLVEKLSTHHDSSEPSRDK